MDRDDRCSCISPSIDARPHPVRGGLGLRHRRPLDGHHARPARRREARARRAHVPRPPRPAHARLRDRPARAPDPVRIPEGEARHWLDSRSSAAEHRPAASPRPIPSPSSASAASAARSHSSSWPAAPRCSASTSTRSIVQALNGQLTQVVRADSTKEEALRQLAIDEFDRVVVAIGDDIAASILTCSVLLGMKIPVDLGEGRQRRARPHPRAARRAPRDLPREGHGAQGRPPRARRRAGLHRDRARLRGRQVVAAGAPARDPARQDRAAQGASASPSPRTRSRARSGRTPTPTPCSAPTTPSSSSVRPARPRASRSSAEGPSSRADAATLRVRRETRRRGIRSPCAPT